MKRLDVITLGRCSVDLYGQQVGGPLEQMSSFAKYVGGCPANIAIGAARLGLKSGFISRVGDEQMGRFIRQQMTAEGVDTSNLFTDPARLTALVILGIRDQKQFPLIFYRENCADMALSESDIDPAFIAEARALVITGTHFSTHSTAAASRKAVESMRQHGGKVIFDIDYRPVLWGLASHGMGEERYISDANVTAHLQSVVPLCDVIVGTEEEFHIAGGTADTDAALQEIRRLSQAVLVCKRGPLGCSIYTGEIKDGQHVAGQEIEVYNVLGAGDAFMSGLLYGYLRDSSWEEAAKFANACGALVVSRHGCAPAMPNLDELQYYLKEGSSHLALRLDPELNHYHWVTTRKKGPDRVLAFAIDHRAQFEKIAYDAQAPLEKIGAFKALALAAIRQVAKQRPGFGMLLDDRYGRIPLYEAGDGALWLARPVELPGSYPLTFEGGEDIGTILLEWPASHIVKCLVFYHPDDPAQIKREQERTLLRLFEACRRTQHEFLLEIVASKNGPLEPNTTSVILAHLYELGIKPDWWKLEPLPDAESWKNVDKVIRQYDPFCKGIVVLGLEAAEEVLVRSFEMARRFAPVKGFAIGRTIFAKVASDWFHGRMSDKEAIDKMAQNFQRLVDAWEKMEQEEVRS